MITEYSIEDLIIISGAREQKKRKPAYSKGKDSRGVKNA
jgi:hypothetical protein